jgi:hypothetical protein
MADNANREVPAVAKQADRKEPPLAEPAERQASAVDGGSIEVGTRFSLVSPKYPNQPNMNDTFARLAQTMIVTTGSIENAAFATMDMYIEYVLKVPRE